MYTMILGSFQKKAVGVAFLMLTFSVIIMVYAEKRNKQNKAYPPLINQCPDYFQYTGTICKDTNKHYGDMTYSIDIGSSLYASTNANAACNKKKWAKDRGITWDGITNSSELTC